MCPGAACALQTGIGPIHPVILATIGFANARSAPTKRSSDRLLRIKSKPHRSAVSACTKAGEAGRPAATLSKTIMHSARANTPAYPYCCYLMLVKLIGRTWYPTAVRTGGGLSVRHVQLRAILHACTQIQHPWRDFLGNAGHAFGPDPWHRASHAPATPRQGLTTRMMRAENGRMNLRVRLAFAAPCMCGSRAVWPPNHFGTDI